MNSYGNRHPLVLLNISDQISRQLPSKGEFSHLKIHKSVEGILLGTLSGSTVTIQDCFEIVQLDFNFITKRIEEFKQVFPSFEWFFIFCMDFNNNGMLGWDGIPLEILLPQRFLKNMSKSFNSLVYRVCFYFLIPTIQRIVQLCMNI